MAQDKILGDYLTVTELAQQLGVSRRTVERWEELRIGPPVTRVGRLVRYRRDAVHQWLRRKEQKVLGERRGQR